MISPTDCIAAMTSGSVSAAASMRSSVAAPGGTMWVELISDFYPFAQFVAPADEVNLNGVERELGQAIPADLRALLLETNGVRDEYLSSAVWTAERIAADNVRFRTFPDFRQLYRPFDLLLFFGDNGGGDQFAYQLDDPAAGIFVWQHESDERRRAADDLEDYLRQIMTSEGDIWYIDEE